MAGRALAVAVAAFAAAAVFLASVMLLREGDGIPEAETKEQVCSFLWNRRESGLPGYRVRERFSL